jgi:hypothetical protein
MILDERNEFADASALDTSGTGLALLGDVVDLGTGTINFGSGQQMYLCVQVTTAVTSAGAATVEFQLVSDAQAAIAADGTETVHGKTAAIGKAALVAGAQFVLPVPQGTSERYIGVQTNVGTAALTAGAVNAFLTLDPPAEYVAYADGI